MNVQPDPGEIFLVDKPSGWSSFQAVKKLRNLTHSKKIGHAGTLDPLATGLLVLCSGKKTKLISQIQDAEKEYTGIIRLGSSTASYDIETEPENFSDLSHVTLEQVLETAKHFTGAVSQVPPLHSAIKVDGKRAYELARKGSDHKLQARTVHISKFEITSFQYPDIGFRVVCSKGTYIRTLADDFGKYLGGSSHLALLRRTRIGEYRVEDAKTPAEWQQLLKPADENSQNTR